MYIHGVSGAVILQPAPGTTCDDDDNSNHYDEVKNYEIFNVEVIVILYGIIKQIYSLV